MMTELSVAEIRELRKAQILGDGGRVIFDKMIADRLVTGGFLAHEADDPDEPTIAGRRRYALTEKGRAALSKA